MPGPDDQTPPDLSAVDALAQLSFVVQGKLERRASAAGVSLSLTRLLGILRDRRPTMQELAGLMELDKSSVTGLVERAERRGFTVRTRSPRDGRSVLVELTDEGRAQVTQLASEFEGDVEGLLHALPRADRAELRTLAERLLTAHAGALGIDLLAPERPRR
ncbi:MAG TPA: MarR family transcriptional regulator [Solirubrobacteraceae bacterium]|jgi:DNA-binding MarR family transcriptional regulator